MYFSKSELKLLEQLARGNKQIHLIAEALKKNKSQIYRIVKSLEKKSS